MESPQIQYVHSADGASIAFYDMGEGTPLVDLAEPLEPPDGDVASASRASRRCASFARASASSGTTCAGWGCPIAMSRTSRSRRRRVTSKPCVSAWGSSVLCCMASCMARCHRCMYAADHSEHVSRLILNVPFADGEGWY